MSQNIAVTVKGFSVTKCIDPKSKADVPTKFKPKAVAALKSVQVDPPKGKTLAPYSVDVAVAITKVTKGVRAEFSFAFSDKDPYSNRDKATGTASAGATVQTSNPNPDKGDQDAALDAGWEEAKKTAIAAVKEIAKKP